VTKTGKIFKLGGIWSKYWPKRSNFKRVFFKKSDQNKQNFQIGGGFGPEIGLKM